MLHVRAIRPVHVGSLPDFKSLIAFDRLAETMGRTPVITKNSSRPNEKVSDEMFGF